MSVFLRICQSLLFLLVPAVAQAQLVSGALTADPARAGLSQAAEAGTARRGTAALTLPFFDDFTTPREGLPDPVRWELTPFGAYVSNRLAVAPLTRGAATLDGLNTNGLAYTPNSSGFGGLDTLTSQPIDLSGLSPTDNVRLSFAWQAGSVVGPARRSGGSTPVLLEADFWDGTVWRNVWFEASTGTVNNFRQTILVLDRPAYFRSDFQFRFRATGNGSTNRDAWSVDYVLLDRNRPANDTTFRDVAISRGLSNPLARYTAMPVWQFNAAPNPLQELNTVLNATINNLSLANTTPTPITWQGTVREKGGEPFGSWIGPLATDFSRSVTSGVRQDVIGGNPQLAPIPLTATPKTLRYELTLLTNEQNQRLNTLSNDSISREVDLRNYYAYDDGTAENILALPALSTGPATYLAYRIDLNQPDQVRGLRLYPVFIDPGARSVTIAIWDNGTDNKPTDVTKPRASATLPLTMDMVRNQSFVELAFPQPVAVSGTFWIGYGQPSQGRFLHYGEDLNSTVKENYLYQNVQNVWQPAAGSRGAPMMRPVMTNFLVTSTATSAASVAFSLYPNPTQSTVRVAGPTFRRAELLDALGRTVWQQPATEAGQPQLNLPVTLPAGLYLVRLTLPTGATAVRRLVVN